MKFGIKLWSTNQELIQNAREHYNKGEFDYIELSAIKDTFDQELLSNIKGIPIIIHCDNSNVNFADKEFNQNNITAIKEAQKFADFFDSKYIIVHPGYSGTIDNVNQLLKQINDQRICIENMPGKTLDLKSNCIARTYEEIKQIKTNNFCLDIAHAIKAAITLNIDPVENIKQLLTLNPIMFHICDGNLNNEIDEHLNISEGQYDFKKILELIKEHDQNNINKPISLETPKHISLDNDINNINKIKKFLISS